MSEFEKDEFEKELTNKVSPHGRTFDGHELFLDIVLLEHFENWQPHKEPVEVPTWMPSTTDSLIDIIDKQLVAIPQLVADFIESENHNEENREGTLVFEHYNSYKGNENSSELHEWIANNFNDFLKAIVNGYTVEKEKKYILKHIDLSEQDNEVSLYLSHGLYKELQHERYSKDVDMSKIKECHFTQSEIDKLNTGSYEQIEVKVEE